MPYQHSFWHFVVIPVLNCHAQISSTQSTGPCTSYTFTSDAANPLETDANMS